jgi:hypothetical protein
MSWDLRVALARQPTRPLISEWAAGHGLVYDTNCIEDASGDMLFTVDGPASAEADDLDEELAAAVPAAAWLLLFSVSLGDDSDRTGELAVDLATFVAERCDGAVFDPQADTVLWPPDAPVPAPSELAGTSALELVWYTNAARGREGGAAYLQATLRCLPPAAPRRYGAYEPPQSRVDAAQPGRFGADWRECDSSSLLWTASPPCLGGEVMFPRAPNIQGARRAVRVSTSFDGRALSDPVVREGVVALFTDVATALRAFHAVAAVRRGVSVQRNRLWVSSESEELDLPYTQWVGLPSTPTWLAWYGEPYAALVAPGLVRASVEPADADALRAAHHRPADALVGSFAERRAAATIPDL